MTGTILCHLPDLEQPWMALFSHLGWVFTYTEGTTMFTYNMVFITSCCSAGGLVLCVPDDGLSRACGWPLWVTGCWTR